MDLTAEAPRIARLAAVGELGEGGTEHEAGEQDHEERRHEQRVVLGHPPFVQKAVDRVAREVVEVDEEKGVRRERQAREEQPPLLPERTAEIQPGERRDEQAVHGDQQQPVEQRHPGERGEHVPRTPQRHAEQDHRQERLEEQPLRGDVQTAELLIPSLEDIGKGFDRPQREQQQDGESLVAPRAARDDPGGARGDHHADGQRPGGEVVAEREGFVHVRHLEGTHLEEADGDQLLRNGQRDAEHAAPVGAVLAEEPHNEDQEDERAGAEASAGERRPEVGAPQQRAGTLQTEESQD